MGRDRIRQPMLFSYLDLQDVVAADTLVVHFVVGVIGIATVLILNKGKTKPYPSVGHSPITGGINTGNIQPAASGAWSGNVTTDKTAKATIICSVSTFAFATKD